MSKLKVQRKFKVQMKKFKKKKVLALSYFGIPLIFGF